MLLRAMVSGLRAPVDWGRGESGFTRWEHMSIQLGLPATKRRVLKRVHVWAEGVYEGVYMWGDVLVMQGSQHVYTHLNVDVEFVRHSFVVIVCLVCGGGTQAVGAQCCIAPAGV